MSLLDRGGFEGQKINKKSYESIKCNNFVWFLFFFYVASKKFFYLYLHVFEERMKENQQKTKRKTINKKKRNYNKTIFSSFGLMKTKSTLSCTL
jgi:low temperature requirement protein LtrA